VGSSASKIFTIYNNSPCNLYYRLQVDQVIDGPYPEEQVRDDAVGECRKKMKNLVLNWMPNMFINKIFVLSHVSGNLKTQKLLFTPNGWIVSKFLS
jgi:hypothetical protein